MIGMNYSNIKYYDIANGPGVRTSLFVSGCRRHCPGCFNAGTWPFDAGTPFTAEAADRIIESLAPDYIDGLTILGGEPFEPENQRGLLPFLQEVRRRCPGRTVWAFSGSTWEEIFLGAPDPGGASHLGPGHARCEVTLPLLELIDVLVDGPFIEAQKDLRLQFRGSRNQRILDVKASLRAGQPVSLAAYRTAREPS